MLLCTFLIIAAIINIVFNKFYCMLYTGCSYLKGLSYEIDFENVDEN